MKRFGYTCEVVGILGVSVFMALASLALSLSRLMASISLALLLLVPRGILSPILSSKYSPLTVVQKGEKIWITMKLLSLTFGIGFERKSNGEIVTHATDNLEEYDNHTQCGFAGSVSVGAARSHSEDEPQRVSNGKMNKTQK